LENKIINIISKKRDIHSNHKIHESVRLGILLAIVGGFLDAYTFIGRGGVFANAQTGNIIMLGAYTAKGEFRQALSHVPPILACIIGVIVVESIKKFSSRLFVSDWKEVVLILEILAIIIVGFIPNTIPNIVVTIIISFVASIQVSSFRKLVDSPYTTTMSTGNLRSASSAAFIAITEKDKKSAIRSIRYFTIIFSFIFGAFLGGFLTLNIGEKAIWCSGIVLIGAVILLRIEGQKTISSEAK
jgi:uncharacterized membrane protein YoaK (UPF0700 family)